MADVMEREVLSEHVAASPAETQAWAEAFAAQLRPGDIVALYGDLGAGKTFLVKAICRALGSQEEPTSPTFTIINEYHAADELFLYHFDFYRIEHPAELVNLGLEEYFYNDHICFIEWPEKIAAHLPPARYEVHLRFIPDRPEAREITLSRVNAAISGAV